MNKFKLELHLIPKTSFGFNLRRHLGGKWTKLSKQIRTEHQFICDLCRDKREPKQIHLHEVWEFDKGIQKLVGFECICATCHSVHHWGLSEIQGKDLQKLLKHACKVNKCSYAEFKQHIQEAAAIWNARSTQQWELDLSYMDGVKYD